MAKTRLLLVFFLFIYFSANGQKRLNGIFIEEWGGKRLTFNRNGTFTYSDSRKGYYYIRGKGEYKIKNKILTLKFIEDPSLENSFVIKDVHCSSTDNLRVIFHVKNKETNEPLSFVTIIIISKPSFQNLASLQTEIDGTALFALPKLQEDSLLIVKISKDKNPILKDIQFNVKLNSCKDITIETLDVYSQIISSETVLEYQIINFSTRELRLQRITGSDITNEDLITLIRRD